MRKIFRFTSSLIAGLIMFTNADCFAQTQTVTLASGGSFPFPVNYPVATNQIVQVMGYQVGGSGVNGDLQLLDKSARFALAVSVPYTSLTNIYLNSGSLTVVTLNITTPVSNTTVISNYVPADAIVIPASATGNVQIILESSPDLVNWTAASPGTYGASAGTNRFFRVRASVTP
ncbi:MAG TPA: hypothetical protein VE344_08150 [Methylomirabilota bacterium]|nr:hypothetical protein [Methylomirabilota bacterium]